MCGIVAYNGNKEAFSLLINGLKRLEYRGYDSAGIALLNGGLKIYKKKGKVEDLQKITSNINSKSTIGIGHTRWATHGAPNDLNSHPHTSQSKNITLVHNGIIENYAALKEELIKRKYKFYTDTDTEVLANLIEDVQINEKCNLTDAVRIALNQVIGAYAIVVMSNKEPDKLVAARLSSPLVIGIGKDEFFVASDASPFVEYTKKVVYLEDGELAVLEKSKKISVSKIKTNKKLDPYIEELQYSLEAIEKAGYEHFMLKEINEQPKSIQDTLRGRLLIEEGIITLGGIKDYQEKLLNANRIIFIACGTSWHAALVAEYLFEEYVRIPVEVEYASEFRYRKPVITENDVVIAISQSGETADTLAGLKLAKSKGATAIGICNVVGSSIARATDAGVYTHAGPEVGVASTKAFTTQLTVVTLMALNLGKEKGTLKTSEYQKLITELNLIPNKIEELLLLSDGIKNLAYEFQEVSNFLYLGRGVNFPAALEGALKLKEISYIHAEGYPAAEMKHGPIALIDKNMPVVVIAMQSVNYEKVVSNIQEIKARNGVVIALVSKGDVVMKKIADYCIEIPKTSEALTPILTTVPLQLLSYYMAVLRGCNVDQPRNLAKSVTVE